MSLRDIGAWLLSNSGFTRELNLLNARMVADELGPDFQKASALRDAQFDWSYLMTCASFLAHATDASSQSEALRIAQACLTIGGAADNHLDAAALILDTLANHPAVALAVRRQLLRPDVRSRLPLPAQIEWTRRKYDNSVVSLGERLPVNRFQKSFWETVQQHDWVSVSAPTSAGKSFIVSQWLAETLASFEEALAVYLVPTRALISQVDRDLRAMLERLNVRDCVVTTAPVAAYLKDGSRNVLVFTQERLSILLAALPDLKVNVLVVDEAHKIGDKARGILLQRVIEDLVRINPEMKVVFASPMSSNPEVLLSDAPVGKITSFLRTDYITVSQNLIWVTQVPRNPKAWKAEVFLQNEVHDLGTFTLTASPIPLSKRLPFVAAALGKNCLGNVIYVNGAAAAETAAMQLYDLLDDVELTQGLDDLITSCAEIVHPQFLLQKVVRRGIAFHYGNLPLLLREEIEALFQTGEIRFLICTSTLVEGVNTSCRNIFVRGPRRGKTQPMSREDFWNLAGRAGRWGREFQGNIICIDANDQEVWGSMGAPKSREKYVIRRATDLETERLPEFVDYVREGAPAQTRASNSRFEATFSYLCDLQVAYGSIANGPWARRMPSASVEVLDEVVSVAREAIQVPSTIIHRNPGISPFAMDALLALLRAKSSLDDLVPASPGSSDAASTYASIVGRCATTIAPSIGPIGKRHFSIALLITQWMRGYQLSRLISERIAAFQRRGDEVNVATVIRSVMEDVEQIARFEAPRFLACYKDVLQLVFAERGRQDLIETYPDLSLLLEYGVSQATQLALITSGVSRTSTIAISEIIGSDTLNQAGVREWLVSNSAVWRESGLSPLVKRELERLLTS